jgi:hypothetical protein
MVVIRLIAIMMGVVVTMVFLSAIINWLACFLSVFLTFGPTAAALSVACHIKASHVLL